MEIPLDIELESALLKFAQERGIAPEILARNVLRERFLAGEPPIIPQDDWERLLLSIGTPCGVSLSDRDLSSEGLYE